MLSLHAEHSAQMSVAGHKNPSVFNPTPEDVARAVPTKPKVKSAKPSMITLPRGSAMFKYYRIFKCNALTVYCLYCVFCFLISLPTVASPLPIIKEADTADLAVKYGIPFL
jgi:hypothetical protein